MEKYEQLTALAKQLGLSRAELQQWYSSYVAENYSTPNIKTALPIVYRRGNTLDVEDGINLNRIDEIFGVRLVCGIVISIDTLDDLNWTRAKMLAEGLTLDGKTGRLPHSKTFSKSDIKKEVQRIFNTFVDLENQNVHVGRKDGYIWLSDKGSDGDKWYFKFNGYDLYNFDLGSPSAYSDIDRLGIEF